MFNEHIGDPTAGERARRARLHPEMDPPITDPTDPRYGAPGSISEPDDVDEVGREAPAERQPTPRI